MEMFIQEVEIIKIFNCPYCKLTFNNQRYKPAYLVQNKDDENCQILTNALKSIFSSVYAELSLVDAALYNGVREGFVSVKFLLPRSLPYVDNDEDDSDNSIDLCSSGAEIEVDLGPSTSGVGNERIAERQARTMQRKADKAKKFCEIHAKRDFRREPDIVSYTIDNGKVQKCEVVEFHSRFRTCVTYVVPMLETECEAALSACDNDWLRLLSLELNQSWNNGVIFEDPFAKFIELYCTNGHPEDAFLCNLMREHIKSSDIKENIQKTTFIKILRDVRGLFEYITNKEYTALFLIPPIKNTVFGGEADDFDFDHMTTYIQDNSKKLSKRYHWTEAHPAIKDMLMIALQVALAYHCKQRLMYLKNFKEIAKYQALQLTLSSYLHKNNVEDAWNKKNYLQRIIDVCVDSRSATIIEYPGCIPLRPVNSHFIQSTKITENSETIVRLENIDNTTYDFGNHMAGFREYNIQQFQSNANRN